MNLDRDNGHYKHQQLSHIYFIKNNKEISRNFTLSILYGFSLICDILLTGYLSLYFKFNF